MVQNLTMLYYYHCKKAQSKDPNPYFPEISKIERNMAKEILLQIVIGKKLQTKLIDIPTEDLLKRSKIKPSSYVKN